MEHLQEWIASHPYTTFLITLLAGAALHWAKKAYRKEIPWNPVAYWLLDNPAHSAGAAGAIVLAWWGALGGDILAGANYYLIITQGVTAGWMIDSAINKAGETAEGKP